MKLFGTILYPKNRYLTLQFSRGGKNVMCEDYFDNMVSIFLIMFILSNFLPNNVYLNSIPHNVKERFKVCISKGFSV